MPLLPEVQRILEAGAAAGLPPDYELPISEVRRRSMAAAQLLNSHPEPVGAVIELRLEVADRAIRARRYSPLEPHPDAGLVVYYHGGGFVGGSLVGYDALLRRLTNHTGWPVLAVDYRLAPEHPYPAGPDDAEAAFSWALEHAAPQGRIAVAGDSAGGNLAAVVSRRRREAGLPGPSCQVLLYPVLDLGPGPEALDYPSYRECAVGYGLTDAHMRWYRSLYLGENEEVEAADISPLRDRRFDGLPATLVITAEYDVLRDEGELYAARLRAAGVPVEVRRFEGHVHGFVEEPMLVDSGRALDQVRSTLTQESAR